MAIWCWHLGFDWNSGQTYLASGFVNLNVAGNPPAPSYQLEPGDQVSFYLFNLTENATASSQTVTSVSFSVTPPTVTPAPPNLFTSTLSSTTSGSAPSTGGSSIFGYGNGGTVMPSTTTFPYWQIAGPLTVNAGTSGLAYVFTCSVTISNGGTTQKTFSVDPEMAVGGLPSGQ